MQEYSCEYFSQHSLPPYGMGINLEETNVMRISDEGVREWKYRRNKLTRFIQTDV